MSSIAKFTFGFYFPTLTKMVGQPRRFFNAMPPDLGVKKSMGFLIVSSLFFTLASLARTEPGNAVLCGSIFFVNALGMALIAAGVSYGIMVMFIGKKITWAGFVNIYALSTGVTLLASWIPFFIWVTEPWKWWLIGTGMTRTFGFTRLQAGFLIGVSFGIIVLLFWSLGLAVSTGR